MTCCDAATGAGARMRSGWLAASCLLSLLWAVPSLAQPAAQEPQALPAVAAPAPPAAVAPVDPAGEPTPAEAMTRKQANRHAIGLTGGFTTGSGFAYRRYFDNTVLQLSGVAFVSDRGDQSMVLAGLSVAQYVVIWHRGATRGIIPNSTALRVVGGASFYQNRSSTQVTNFITDPACIGRSSNCGTIEQTSVKKDRTSLVGVGAGIGFEFGALMRPGFSLSLDLLLTAAFDEQGLSFLLPLPQMALMYNW